MISALVADPDLGRGQGLSVICFDHGPCCAASRATPTFCQAKGRLRARYSRTSSRQLRTFPCNFPINAYGMQGLRAFGTEAKKPIV